MGHYLEALHHTGFYYTFIGVVQILAAILLLVPRTVILGALLYFPLILNICVLSYAVRFEGSILTSPLMLCPGTVEKIVALSLLVRTEPKPVPNSVIVFITRANSLTPA